MSQLSRQLGRFADGVEVHAMTVVRPDILDEVVAMGFSEPLAAGQRVLPDASLGKRSNFNANGREIIRRDLPKETKQRQVYWEWDEWRGQDTVRKSEVREVEYQRYVREQVAAPSIEFDLVALPTGQLAVVSPPFENTDEGRSSLILSAQILVECLGDTDFVGSDLVPPNRGATRRLNWELLPRGRSPWANIRAAIAQRIAANGPNTQAVIDQRFETVCNYGPDFTAIGRAGFAGYVVFGFEDRGLYLLECTETDNATYGFNTDWEALSHLTKAEIIGGQRHVARLIHRRSWFADLAALMQRFPVRPVRPPRARRSGR